MAFGWLMEKLFGREKDVDDLEDVQLNLASEEPEKQTKEGIVTRLESGFRMIDHKYFWPDELKPRRCTGRTAREAELLAVGDRVRYVLERKEARLEWKVVDVEIIGDASEEEDFGESDAKRPPQFHRIGVVHRVESGGQARGKSISVRLDGYEEVTISSEALDADCETRLGDLLDVEFEDRETELGCRLLSVKPLRLYESAGAVEFYDSKARSGVLTGDVFFDDEVCLSHVRPRKGDQVRFRAVECEPSGRNKFSCWRASWVARELENTIVAAELTRVVPGRRRRPADQGSTKFLSRKAKAYDVPEELWRYQDSLVDRYPNLVDNLSMANYVARFSTLLHLEEMAEAELIAAYEMHGAKLFRRGEYLGLEVPGLSEKRPSLVIGDCALVQTAADGYAKVFEGCINEVLSTAVLMSFHSSFHHCYAEETCRVRFKLNRSQYRKCHQAVEMATQCLGEEFLFPSKANLTVSQTVLPVAAKCENLVTVVETSKLGQSGYILPVLPRVSLLVLKPSSVTSKIMLQRPPFLFTTEDLEASDSTSTRKPNGLMVSAYPSYLKAATKQERKKQSRSLTWYNTDLNLEQKQAVLRILKGEARPLPYVIFGPPGTGKTVTVVESVLQLFCLRDDARILIATPTNSSADLITERLRPNVPVGSMARLNSFQRAEEAISESIRDFCFSNEVMETLKDVLRHRIVIATCATAGSFLRLGLKTPPFTHSFLDEAGHMTEPEAMIPIGLTFIQSGQIVMAGDPKQLGPVLQSEAAKSYGLQESFLERLTKRNPYRRNMWAFAGNSSGYDPALVTMLRKNYRSHKSIIEIPSQLFYHSELEAVSEKAVTEKFLGVKFLPNHQVPIVFHGVRGPECQDDDSPSWYNAGEAFLVVQYLKQLYELDVSVSAESVGIIAPYRKQVEKIRDLIDSLDLERVKVGSVEEFQGREKEVILVSTVRSASAAATPGPGPRLGFMNCEKRFNVAVTRAKSLLVVVGDPDVLSSEPCWQSFLRYCIDNRACKGCVN